MSSVKYRVFFPENGGYFFVGGHHSASEGSSSLVFSQNSHRYFIRRKVAEVDSNSSNSKCPEIDHYTPHNRLAEQVWSCNYPDSIVGYPSSTNSVITISRFCNRGISAQISEMFSFENDEIPEVLVWRMLQQLFEILAFFHMQAKPRIALQNLQPETILVDLPASGPGWWPDFYLGNLGSSRVLDTRRDGTSDEVCSGKRDASRLVAQDIKSLVRCVLRLIADESADTEDIEGALHELQSNRKYSSGLVACLKELVGFAHTVADSDINRYNPKQILSKIVETYNNRSRNFSSRTTLSWQKNIEPSPVMEFDSEDELKRYPDLPAGPWLLAKVDAPSGRILNKSQRVYMSEKM